MMHAYGFWEVIGLVKVKVLFMFKSSYKILNVLVAVAIKPLEEYNIGLSLWSNYDIRSLFSNPGGNLPRTLSWEESFEVPPYLEILFQYDLKENALQQMHKDPEVVNQLKKLLPIICALFKEGPTQSNYIQYFHYLLWWEEIQAKLNLMKYNMPNVKLDQIGNQYILKVPGVAEKRPSLLPGDTVFLQPKSDPHMLYSCVIRQITGNNVYIEGCNPSRRLEYNHTPATIYVAKFMSSRSPIIHPHEAVERLFTSNQSCRVFPVCRHGVVVLPFIDKFYNPSILSNKEQRRAVENIVAGSSGTAPYILFGPPGTGKTMTIVEAIVQIVASNPSNRVMVCTNSNMAADHIALMLLKYEKYFNYSYFIIRSHSESRDRSTMPADLVRISNRKNCENINSRENLDVSAFRIMVTTLGHAARYAFPRCELKKKVQISHLFIDEAGQATEPQCLIPITGLLSANGQLVLAGDPQQLGPVCISKEASKRGLGTSLLERLLVKNADLYENDPTYMTMLVKNFRSDGDILKLPNQLFYKGKLIAMASPDAISRVSILGLAGGDRATVFHAVQSRENTIADTPSYFNEEELEILKEYLIALLIVHKVAPEDVGIISPYNKQVYKIKEWLGALGPNKIEVGSVEAFQGKEKRVILVSTVRTEGLGFLVDEKRFNVTLTRAKAKIIIVGNPKCLSRNKMWNRYIKLCKMLKCYFNETVQQLPTIDEMFQQVARTKSKVFEDKCVMTGVGPHGLLNVEFKTRRTNGGVSNAYEEQCVITGEGPRGLLNVEIKTRRDNCGISNAFEEKCVLTEVSPCGLLNVETKTKRENCGISNAFEEKSVITGVCHRGLLNVETKTKRENCGISNAFEEKSVITGVCHRGLLNVETKTKRENCGISNAFEEKSVITGVCHRGLLNVETKTKRENCGISNAFEEKSVITGVCHRGLLNVETKTKRENCGISNAFEEKSVITGVCHRGLLNVETKTKRENCGISNAFEEKSVITGVCHRGLLNVETKTKRENCGISNAFEEKSVITGVCHRGLLNVETKTKRENCGISNAFEEKSVITGVCHRGLLNVETKTKRQNYGLSEALEEKCVVTGVSPRGLLNVKIKARRENCGISKAKKLVSYVILTGSLIYLLLNRL